MTACGLCGSVDLARELGLGDLRVGLCGGCGSGRVTDLGGRAQTAEEYAEAYAAESVEGKAEQCWGLFEPRVSARGVLLDLGCGGGEFLGMARAAGWTTRGVELSVDGTERARAAGHDVTRGSVLDPAAASPRSADAVVLWDLLEHLDAPRVALRNAAAWLRPGGSLLLLTPHMKSAFDRAGLAAHAVGLRGNPLLRMCWSEAHLYRFSVAGLRRELLRSGFEDVRIETVLLLSLRPDRYAGGALLPDWTGVPALDARISRWGVRAAKALSIRNKALVVARRAA